MIERAFFLHDEKKRIADNSIQNYQQHKKYYVWEFMNSKFRLTVISIHWIKES